MSAYDFYFFPSATVMHRQQLREYQQKAFITLSRFRLLRGWKVLVNLLKKENCDENLFLR